MKSTRKSSNYSHVLTNIFLFVYKGFLSPLISGINKTVFGVNSQCIHTPTCSQYFASQVARYGIIQGGIKGIKRLITCQNLYQNNKQ